MTHGTHGTHQDTLVLEGVTLRLEVELMVQVAINLLGLPEIGDTLLVVYVGWASIFLETVIRCFNHQIRCFNHQILQSSDA